jgi:hypothetical protein
VSYIILNGAGGLMRVAWFDDDKRLQEESRWETKEEAELALSLLTEYAIGGETEAVHGLRIVQAGDA